MMRTRNTIGSVVLTTVLLALLGCDPIQFSPYEVETSPRNLTAINLAKVESRSQAAFAPFKFAVVSDTHDGYGRLQEAASLINQRDDLSFVLHAGDMTNSGLLKEFEWTEEVLQGLDIPYLTVIGNHDALNNGKENYAAIYGPEDYSFVFNQVKFVALNSNSWEYDNKVPRLPWLEQQLGDYHLYSHQIVLTHILPQDSRFPMALSDSYKQILMDNFVSLVIAGHDHSHRYWEETLSSGMPIGFLTNGSTLKELFTIISVESGAVTVTKVAY